MLHKNPALLNADDRTCLTHIANRIFFELDQNFSRRFVLQFPQDFVIKLVTFSKDPAQALESLKSWYDSAAGKKATRFWKAVIDNKYPFDPTREQSVPLDETLLSILRKQGWQGIDLSNLDEAQLACESLHYRLKEATRYKTTDELNFGYCYPISEKYIEDFLAQAKDAHNVPSYDNVTIVEKIRRKIVAYKERAKKYELPLIVASRVDWILYPTGNWTWQAARKAAEVLKPLLETLEPNNRTKVAQNIKRLVEESTTDFKSSRHSRTVRYTYNDTVELLNQKLQCGFVKFSQIWMWE